MMAVGPPSGRTARFVALVAALGLACLALPVGAGAASSSVPTQPQFDEYVPSLPASTGPKGPPGGRPKTTGIPLQPAARTALRRTAPRERKTLRRLATSTELGAPAGVLRDGPSGTFDAGAATAAQGLTHVGLVLLLVIIAITVGLAAAALAIRRRLRPGG
jgi:hypothetical protein